MSILAIDPGTTRSAWVELGTDGRPTHFTVASDPNDEALDILHHFRHGSGYVSRVVIERIEPRYGRQIGMETLVTAEWVGRFAEAAQPLPVFLIRRSAVLRHLGVSGRAADAGVRAALIDRFGGKAAAIGTVRSPGPLHGIHGDAWSALAVAVAFHDDPELAEPLP